MSRATFTFALLLIILGLTACESMVAQDAKPKTMRVIRMPVERIFNPAFKGKAESEIELIEHQLSDALRTTDAAALDKLLSDTVLIAGLIATKDQLIALLKKANTKYNSLEKSEMRIQLYGNTAVAAGTLKSDIDIENGSRMSQSTFFNTWKLITGRWQCIALAN